MNENKIDFIICHNEDTYINSCIEQINKLIIPDGFEKEILGVSGADSIVEAYNCLMNESNAKYKVYLFPNVLITDRYFVVNVINSFENDSKLGLIGVLGCSEVSFENVNWNVGKVHIGDEKGVTTYVSPLECEVEAINGFILATQIDLTWEDSEAGMAFFDIKHSIKMKEEGYGVGVLNTASPSCYYEPAFSDFEHSLPIIDETQYITEANGEILPLVSCIVSAYNAENFLGETIDGIINQTYPNLEIVVVDDASLDSTADVIKEYQKKDSRIVPLLRENNENVCVAENEGYSISTGEYIALCGHDDIWDKKKIEQQMFFMHRYSKVGACFTLCRIIGDNGEDISDKEAKLCAIINQRNRDRREELMKELFFRGNMLCAPSALIRRAVIGERMYKVGLLQLQDYDLWLNVLTKSDIHILQKQLLSYRRFSSEENLSSDKNCAANRCSREEQYITFTLLDEMDDDLFTSFFKSMFMRQDSASHEELLCERAMLLKEMKNYNAINYLMRLVDDSKVRRILAEKYNFTMADMYKFTDETLKFELELSVKNDIYVKQIAQLGNIIRNMSN